MSIHTYILSDVNTTKLVQEIYDSVGKLVISTDNSEPDGWLSYSKSSGQLYIEFDPDLTPTESSDLDTLVDSHVPGVNTEYSPVYKLETRTKGKVQKIEWFENDDGDGTYSGLARDEIYTWNGNSLESKTITYYFSDGGVKSKTTEFYYTTSGGEFVTKVNP